MSKPLLWLLGVAGLALVTVGCVAMHRDGIESGLDARTTTALAGVPGVATEVSGRDVTLVGTVRTEAERARATAAASSVAGVRVVRDALTVSPAAAGGAPAAFAGLFALTQGPAGLVVRGRAPDAPARSQVIEHVRAAFPGQEVEDRMTTDSTAGDWQEALRALLPAASDVTQPDVTIGVGAVVLRGRVASAADKSRIEAAIREGLPAGYTLRSALAVAADPGAATRDQLAASGDAALAAAEAALGDALAVGHIEFDSGTARLTDRSREILDRAAAVFARFPDAAADIRGYTDSEGDRRGNRTLSTRRAEATRDYLAQKGVRADRLAPRGFGEADPVATNDTDAGRARNRRVVFALRQN